jgi:hypothetical protein
MSDVQVIVNAVDNASKVLKGVQGEITKTGKAGQAASGNLSGMSKVTAGLGGQMKGLASTLAGPLLGFTALSGAVVGVSEFLKSSVNTGNRKAILKESILYIYSKPSTAASKSCSIKSG